MSETIAQKQDAREVPVAEWLNKAKHLFGDDPKQWKFQCPCCGHIQTLVDFETIGAEPQLAYQECIGRKLPHRASDFATKPAKNGEKSPCDYAAYGLFRAMKGYLVIPEGGGAAVPTLPFAEEPQESGQAPSTSTTRARSTTEKGDH